MGKTTFFTPSYRGDLERYILLRESIKRFYQGPARCVVAVPIEDVKIFKKALSSSDTEVFAQNDLIGHYYYPPKWYNVLKKMLPSQEWRFHKYSNKRGWIIQQIVKLSLPEIVQEGAVIIADSDIVFIRPFDKSDLGIDKDTRILLRHMPLGESGKQPELIISARQLLKLPLSNEGFCYMAYPAILYVDWVVKLREYLEHIYMKPWQRVLYETVPLSEYCIYGVFIEEILKPVDLSICNKRFDYMAWDLQSFEQFNSGGWDHALVGAASDYISVVIQSNLGIPVEKYRSKIYDLWSKNELFKRARSSIG